MDRRQLLFGMTALGLTKGLTLPDLLNTQNVETGDSLLQSSSVRISDRERAGLRGPVRMSDAESGTRFGKTGATQEYDPDGRLLASRRLLQESTVPTISRPLLTQANAHCENVN